MCGSWAPRPLVSVCHESVGIPTASSPVVVGRPRSSRRRQRPGPSGVVGPAPVTGQTPVVVGTSRRYQRPSASSASRKSGVPP
jgi:hypothetical protein